MNNRSMATLAAFVIGLLSIGPLIAHAHEDDESAKPRADIPQDDLNRGTPMRSAEGYLAAVDAGNYERAAEYLDLRNLRGEAADLDGEELARRLFVVAKRATWLEVDELSDDPNGFRDDGLPSYRDSIGVVEDEENDIRLFMQKVPRGDGVSIWKVSNATVSLIPELYDVYGYPEAIETLRQNLPNVSFLGYELFKWVILLAITVVTYLAVLIFALLMRRYNSQTSPDGAQRVFRFLTLPFALWLIVLLVNAAASALGTGLTIEGWKQITPVPTLITVWMLFTGVNLLRDGYTHRLQQLGRSGAAVFMRPAANAFKLLLAVLAVLFYLDKLGVDITTVLAGLGVGGVAVALALQKPMEDVFAALTLYTQQPVRVGDFCAIGGYSGTIEEIGLRTTRIRTLENTVIAIPNSRLANEPIDNISARERIRYKPQLRLRLDTTPEALREVLGGVRELLKNHPDIVQPEHRVQLIEIADDALVVAINSFVNTTDWGEYLEKAQDLNIRLLDIVAAAGARLTPPTRTLQIEQQA